MQNKASFRFQFTVQIQKFRKFAILVKQTVNYFWAFLKCTQNKLFNENLGTTKDSEQLVFLQQKYSEYDPSYVFQSVAVSRSEQKDFIEHCWQKYY